MHLLLMGCGVGLSFPSVLAPALTADHAAIPVTDDELNSIMGVYGLAGALGFVVFPMTMQWCGRKLTNILLNLCVITGSITIAVAPSVPVLITGRAIHGLTLSAYYIGCSMTAEYTHPKRRGFYIVFKGIFGGFGELLCHSLGLTILTYQQTALLAIVPAVLSILVTLRWPESPQYLAYKGRYKECVAAFEWLRGTDPEAKKELRELILSQKERRKLETDELLARTLEAVRSKGFWMPMFIVFWVDVACQSSGMMFMASYANEIVTIMSGDRQTAFYYTLALDILKMISILVSSILMRLVKRRTVFFSSGATACAVLVAICLLYYLDKIGIMSVKWLTPSLFVSYYVIVNLATVPVCMVILGEVIPIKYKGVGTLFSGTVFIILGLWSLMYTWKLIHVLDIHGTFGICLGLAVVSYAILLFFLPETKDRTLQNIDNEFAGANVICDEVHLDVEEKTYNFSNKS